MPPPLGAAPSDVPAGWHPDPWAQAPLRWWDGRGWTAHVTGYGPIDGQFPGPTPVDPVDPVEQVALAEGTATWLTRLVLAMPLITFGSIVGFGVMFGQVFDLIEDIDTSPTADADRQIELFFDRFGVISGGFAVLQILNLVGLAVLVMRMVWTYRSVNAARALGRGGTREPGLACAGWIIPVVNLWWPYQTVRDLFPVTERPGNRLTTWWITYLVGIVGISTAVVAIFLPWGAVILLAVLASIPTAISVVLERRLITEATALLRRDADAAGT